MVVSTTYSTLPLQTPPRASAEGYISSYLLEVAIPYPQEILCLKFLCLRQSSPRPIIITTSSTTLSSTQPQAFIYGILPTQTRTQLHTTNSKQTQRNQKKAKQKDQLKKNETIPLPQVQPLNPMPCQYLLDLDSSSSPPRVNL